MTFPTKIKEGFDWDATSNAAAFVLPATIGAGDLLIALIMKQGGNATSGATDSTADAWTEIGTGKGGAGVSQYLTAYAKLADGDEDGGTLTVAHDEGAVMVVACFLRYAAGNWHGTTMPEGGVAVSYSAGNGTAPDPPNLAPSWGAEDTEWVTFISRNSTWATPTQPANYSALVDGTDYDENVTGSNGARVAFSSRQLNAASENPGVWTLGTGDDWCAQTIAIRPAGGAATTFYTTTELTISPYAD